MTEGRTEARCIRECIWQGRRWRPGETYRGAETPPEHFEPLPAPGGRNDSPEAPEAPETGEAEKEE